MRSTYWPDRIASTSTLRIAGRPGAMTTVEEAAVEGPMSAVVAMMGVPEVDVLVDSELFPRPSLARIDADGRQMASGPVVRERELQL